MNLVAFAQFVQIEKSRKEFGHSFVSDVVSVQPENKYMTMKRDCKAEHDCNDVCFVFKNVHSPQLFEVWFRANDIEEWFDSRLTDEVDSFKSEARA